MCAKEITTVVAREQSSYNSCSGCHEIESLYYIITASSSSRPSALHAVNNLITPSEVFVETLVNHKTKYVFGIVGSAYMDALDLFPTAGIEFVSVQHEQNAVSFSKCRQQFLP